MIRKRIRKKFGGDGSIRFLLSAVASGFFYKSSTFIKRRCPKLKPVLKFLLGSIPIVNQVVRSSIHRSFLKSEEKYTLVKVDDLVVYFSEIGLKDTRGIGRVTKEIYNSLLNRGRLILEGELEEGDRIVHFYSSIHWSPEVPPKPSVVMIHDVIPLVFPKLFPDVVHEWSVRNKKIANLSEKIVTISQTSANDIAKYLKVEPSKIDTIYNGITDFSSLEVDCFDVPCEGQSYVVYIGAVDAHKNINVVFEAMKCAEISDVHLCLIGGNEKAKADVIKLGLSERVHFLGRLSDSQMYSVLKNSSALVFPSIYEGFGLPPFEAAQMGAASICSPQPVVKELLGDAVYYAQHDSPSEWARAIRKLTDDDVYASLLRDKTLEKCNHFNWESTVDLLIASCDSIAEPYEK